MGGEFASSYISCQKPLEWFLIWTYPRSDYMVLLYCKIVVDNM